MPDISSANWAAGAVIDLSLLYSASEVYKAKQKNEYLLYSASEAYKAKQKKEHVFVSCWLSIQDKRKRVLYCAN